QIVAKGTAPTKSSDPPHVVNVAVPKAAPLPKKNETRQPPPPPVVHGRPQIRTEPTKPMAPTRPEPKAVPPSSKSGSKQEPKPPSQARLEPKVPAHSEVKPAQRSEAKHLTSAPRVETKPAKPESKPPSLSSTGGHARPTLRPHFG